MQTTTRAIEQQHQNARNLFFFLLSLPHSLSTPISHSAILFTSILIDIHCNKKKKKDERKKVIHKSIIRVRFQFLRIIVKTSFGSNSSIQHEKMLPGPIKDTCSSFTSACYLAPSLFPYFFYRCSAVAIVKCCNFFLLLRLLFNAVSLSLSFHSIQ